MSEPATTIQPRRDRRWAAHHRIDIVASAEAYWAASPANKERTAA